VHGGAACGCQAREDVEHGDVIRRAPPHLLVLAALLGSGVAVAMGGCGGGPPPKTEPTEIDATQEAVPPPDTEPVKKGPVYPAPYTWEQIRAATKSGRTYRYRVEMPGKPTRERVLTFTKVDEDGCEIFAGGGEPKRKGWVSLQKDAEFPKDRVKTYEESVKLPGGKFDCIVYEVRGKDGEVSTYYFAKTLPGAPVLFWSEVDGKRVRTTTLLQHIQGKGDKGSAAKSGDDDS
jgi:hypothetical protein